MTIGDRLYNAVPMLDVLGDRPSAPFTSETFEYALMGAYFASQFDGQHISSMTYPIDFRPGQESPWLAAASINSLSEQEVLAVDWDNPSEWNALIAHIRFSVHFPTQTHVFANIRCTRASPALSDVGLTRELVCSMDTAELIQDPSDVTGFFIAEFEIFCDVSLVNTGPTAGHDEISVRMRATDDSGTNARIIRPLHVGVKAVKR